MKKAFKMKFKAFFIIFKGLSLKQIKQFFGRSESVFKLETLKVNENPCFSSTTGV